MSENIPKTEQLAPPPISSQLLVPDDTETLKVQGQTWFKEQLLKQLQKHLEIELNITEHDASVEIKFDNKQIDISFDSIPARFLS